MSLKDVEKIAEVQLTKEESASFIQWIREEAIERGEHFQKRMQATDREKQAYCAGYFDAKYLACRTSFHPETELKGK